MYVKGGKENVARVDQFGIHICFYTITKLGIL